MIDDPEGNQLVVFTSYMRQKYASFEQVPFRKFNGNKDPTLTSYPTIFFYSLSERKIVWEIFGADAFVHLKQDKQVFFLSNKKWGYAADDRANKDSWAI